MDEGGSFGWYELNDNSTYIHEPGYANSAVTTKMLILQMMRAVIAVVGGHPIPLIK